MCDISSNNNTENDTFELAQNSEKNWDKSSLEDSVTNERYSVCDYYLNIVDQLLAQPERVVPSSLSDREIF